MTAGFRRRRRPVGAPARFDPAGGRADEARLDGAQTRQVLAGIAHLARPYRREAVLAGFTVVGYALTLLGGPFLLKLAIDHGIVPKNGRTLNIIVGLYVVVAVCSWWLEGVQIRVVARIGESFLRDLRIAMFAHLQRLSMPFYDREKAGVLVSRMTADIDTMEDLVQQGFVLILTNAVLVVVAVVMLAAVSWQLLLFCALPLPLVLAATYKFNRDSNRAYLKIRNWVGATLTSLQEGISGVRVIQAYAREDHEVEQFSRHNRGLYGEYMHSVWISCWYLPIIEFAGIGTTAIVIAAGGVMTLHDVVTIGTVGFFVLSLSNLFDPIQQLSQYFNQVQSAGAGMVKLMELLQEPIEVQEAPDPVSLPARGVVEVQGVSFAYGDATDVADRVLNDVNLTIAAGERLALVGPTGAGKSTLAKLIARLYDPTVGTVTFDGIDLRDVSMVSLRERICVVPQEGFLFNGTLLDNIRLAQPQASVDDVTAALDRIGVLDHFLAMPGGLDLAVNERGSRLSAGEKQMVSLARAALADPAVLILDEATSSLDPGTEAVVEAAMERLMGDRTVIVIAHRLATSQRADRVGVVAGGRLAEIGTHDELVSAGGHYAALYATWIHGLGTTPS